VLYILTLKPENGEIGQYIESMVSNPPNLPLVKRSRGDYFIEKGGMN
jgi:hypothetical protein